MASYTGARTYHKTLSTTTVDTVALTNIVEFTIKNEVAAGGANISFTYSGGGTPTTPVAGANDTFTLVPGEFVTIQYKYAGTVTIKLIGNSNPYSVESL